METDIDAHHNAAGAANFVTVNGEEKIEEDFSSTKPIYLNIVNMASAIVNFKKCSLNEA